MRHGPCGAENPDAPCMVEKDGNKMMKCQKGFPKPFREETEWDDSTCYPLYRRRNNGRVYTEERFSRRQSFYCTLQTVSLPQIQ